MATLDTTKRKFHDRYKVVDSGCWEWTATLCGGYGKMMAFGEQYAHRVAYIIYKGGLGDKDCVMHVCDNPCCVNPNHLVKGSHKDNMKDMAGKKRAAWGEAHKDSKLTKEAVIELRKNKDSIHAIVKDFGVAFITARQAQRGITWKNISI